MEGSFSQVVTEVSGDSQFTGQSNWTDGINDSLNLRGQSPVASGLVKASQLTTQEVTSSFRHYETKLPDRASQTFDLNLFSKRIFGVPPSTIAINSDKLETETRLGKRTPELSSGHGPLFSVLHTELSTAQIHHTSPTIVDYNVSPSTTIKENGDSVLSLGLRPEEPESGYLLSVLHPSTDVAQFDHTGAIFEDLTPSNLDTFHTSTERSNEKTPDIPFAISSEYNVSNFKSALLVSAEELEERNNLYSSALILSSVEESASATNRNTGQVEPSPTLAFQLTSDSSSEIFNGISLETDKDIIFIDISASFNDNSYSSTATRIKSNSSFATVSDVNTTITDRQGTLSSYSPALGPDVIGSENSDSVTRLDTVVGDGLLLMTSLGGKTNEYTTTPFLLSLSGVSTNSTDETKSVFETLGFQATSQLKSSTEDSQSSLNNSDYLIIPPFIPVTKTHAVSISSQSTAIDIITSEDINLPSSASPLQSEIPSIDSIPSVETNGHKLKSADVIEPTKATDSRSLIPKNITPSPSTSHVVNNDEHCVELFSASLSSRVISTNFVFDAGIITSDASPVKSDEENPHVAVKATKQNESSTSVTDFSQPEPTNIVQYLSETAASSPNISSSVLGGTNINAVKSLEDVESSFENYFSFVSEDITDHTHHRSQILDKEYVSLTSEVDLSVEHIDPLNSKTSVFFNTGETFEDNRSSVSESTQNISSFSSTLSTLDIMTSADSLTILSSSMTLPAAMQTTTSVQMASLGISPTSVQLPMSTTDLASDQQILRSNGSDSNTDVPNLLQPSASLPAPYSSSSQMPLSPSSTSLFATPSLSQDGLHSLTLSGNQNDFLDTDFPSGIFNDDFPTDNVMQTVAESPVSSDGLMMSSIVPVVPSGGSTTVKVPDRTKGAGSESPSGLFSELNETSIIIASAAALFVLALFILIIIFCVRRKRLKKAKARNREENVVWVDMDIHMPLPSLTSHPSAFEVNTSGNTSVKPENLYKAAHDYKSQQEGQLSFVEGDVIQLVETAENGWWRGVAMKEGETGWFPSSFVVKITDSTEALDAIDAKQSEVDIEIKRNSPLVCTVKPLPQRHVSSFQIKKPDSLKEGERGNNDERRAAYPILEANDTINDVECWVNMAASVSMSSLPTTEMSFQTKLSDFATAVRGHKFRAVYAYKPVCKGEMGLKEGELVLCKERDRNGWMFGTKPRTQEEGWFPAVYVDEVLSDDESASDNEEPLTYEFLEANKGLKSHDSWTGIEHIAVFPYEAIEIGDMSFDIGDTIIVFKTLANGWWFGAKAENSTSSGWFPSSYVEIVVDDSPIVLVTNATSEDNKTPAPDKTEDVDSAKKTDKETLTEKTEISPQSSSEGETATSPPAQELIDKLPLIATDSSPSDSVTKKSYRPNRKAPAPPPNTSPNKKDNSLAKSNKEDKNTRPARPAPAPPKRQDSVLKYGTEKNNQEGSDTSKPKIEKPMLLIHGKRPKVKQMKLGEIDETSLNPLVRPSTRSYVHRPSSVSDAKIKRFSKQRTPEPDYPLGDRTSKTPSPSAFSAPSQHGDMKHPSTSPISDNSKTSLTLIDKYASPRAKDFVRESSPKPNFRERSNTPDLRDLKRERSHSPALPTTGHIIHCVQRFASARCSPVPSSDGDKGDHTGLDRRSPSSDIARSSTPPVKSHWLSSRRAPRTMTSVPPPSVPVVKPLKTHKDHQHSPLSQVHSSPTPGTGNSDNENVNANTHVHKRKSGPIYSDASSQHPNSEAIEKPFDQSGSTNNENQERIYVVRTSQNVDSDSSLKPDAAFKQREPVYADAVSSSATQSINTYRRDRSPDGELVYSDGSSSGQNQPQHLSPHDTLKHPASEQYSNMGELRSFSSKPNPPQPAEKPKIHITLTEDGSTNTGKNHPSDESNTDVAHQNETIYLNGAGAAQSSIGDSNSLRRPSRANRPDLEPPTRDSLKLVPGTVSEIVEQINKLVPTTAEIQPRKGSRGSIGTNELSSFSPFRKHSNASPQGEHQRSKSSDSNCSSFGSQSPVPPNSGNVRVHSPNSAGDSLPPPPASLLSSTDSSGQNGNEGLLYQLEASYLPGSGVPAAPPDKITEL